MTPCSCLERGGEERCAACRFGVCPGCTYPNEIQCRRRAPVSSSQSLFDAAPRPIWPLVPRSGWCGEYEARAPVGAGEFMDRVRRG